MRSNHRVFTICPRTTKSFNSNNNKNVFRNVVHIENRVHCVTNGFGVLQGGRVIRYENTLKSSGFHYLSSYNWQDEGVTTKSFNSNNNKNVSMNEVHRKNRVAFCNKWVWVPQGVIRYKHTLKS